ncbi:putative phage antirepressor, partial [Candidatus Regiella insecticola LSR1]
ATYFGKLHKDVIAKIESLDCSREFASANLSAHVENIRAGAVNRDSKYYEMTKDGFVFLVMGFTGKKAAAFKEAYITEFNRMEAELSSV